MELHGVKNDKDEYEREKHGQSSVTFTSLITLETKMCYIWNLKRTWHSLSGCLSLLRLLRKRFTEEKRLCKVKLVLRLISFNTLLVSKYGSVALQYIKRHA